MRASTHALPKEKEDNSQALKSGMPKENSFITITNLIIYVCYRILKFIKTISKRKTQQY